MDLTITKESPAFKHLTQVDPVLSQLIHQVGDYKLTLKTDYFSALIRTIVGQQLSSKVAQVLWHRLLIQVGQVTPEKILSTHYDIYRQVGLSGKKSEYIRNLAAKVHNQELNLSSIEQLDDEQIMVQLTALKGIGQWTAEMFLIFSLGRQDILSLADVGLKRAIMRLYVLAEQPSPAIMTSLGQIWSPYRSIASLYLWEVINQNLRPPT